MDFEAAVSTVNEGLDGLSGADVATLTDGELSDAVVELQRLKARLDAAEATVVGVWDRRRVWASDGARSGAAWLVWRCRMARSRASRLLRRARHLREMPEAQAALEQGEITGDHVDALGRVRRDDVADAFERDEADLVTNARRLRFDHFAKTLKYWEQLADPDGVEGRAQRLERDRHGHMSKTFDGVHVLDATFEPIGGAEFSAALKTIEQELFESDWAEAKAKYGDDVTPGKLSRTPAQRRADALVEMARRAMSAPRDGRTPRPLITVLADKETTLGRICELADGTVVTPGQIAGMLTRADLERVIFDGPSRVIDVGAKQRLFTGATRRAVEVRDRECWHPTCDEPADDCDVDHIERFEHDGLTIQANGRLACPYHNPGRRRPKTPRGP